MERTLMNEDPARVAALKRLEDKRGFWNFFVVFIVVSAALIGIWAITGSGFFWPAFPIGGMAIGLVMSAWGVFGQKPITDADVDRELERERGA
jgi:hypothetical protein